MLVNDKKPENDVNLQIIKSETETETCTNNEILMSLLLATNSSGIAIKNEIEDVSENSKLSETINSNLEKCNLHEIQIDEELPENSDNIDAKTEITHGDDDYSKYNLNKSELNIDDDSSDRTENFGNSYFSSNTDEVSATTIFEHNASVKNDTQLICNVNKAIPNRKQIFNSDHLSKLNENELPQIFSVDSSEGLNTINATRNGSTGKNIKKSLI